MRAKLVCIVVLALACGPLLADQGDIPVRACIAPFSGDPNDVLVKYKCYTRAVLYSIWVREMKINETSLWFGEVHVRCTIYSNGVLANPTVTLGESCGLLKSISLHSLTVATPFKPFSDALVKETGSSYTDEFSFSVLRRPPAPGTSEDRAYGGEKLNSPSSGMD